MSLAKTAFIKFKEICETLKARIWKLKNIFFSVENFIKWASKKNKRFRAADVIGWISKQNVVKSNVWNICFSQTKNFCDFTEITQGDRIVENDYLMNLVASVILISFMYDKSFIISFSFLAWCWDGNKAFEMDFPLYESISQGKGQSNSFSSSNLSRVE